MELLAGPLRLATGVVALIILFIAYDRYKAWRRRVGGAAVEDGKAVSAARFVVRVFVWLFILMGALTIVGILRAQYEDRNMAPVARPPVPAVATVEPEVRQAAEDYIAAVKAGDLESVRNALEFIDLDKRVRGSTYRPLGVAIDFAPNDSHGDAIILHLLERGADASSPDDLLARVIYENRLELVDEFIHAGASVQPALRAALRCKCDARIKDVFDQLLVNGADPYAKDANGYDVFVPTSHMDHVNEDRKRLLLSRYEKQLASRADSGDAITAQGQTRLVEAVINGEPSIVERFLAAGADPNLPTPEGHLPLGRAVMVNDEEIVRLLLRAGANPYLPSATGTTPIALAAGYGFDGNLDVLRLLLALPGDVDKRSDGNSALYSATTASKRYAMRYLIAAGASPWSRSAASNAPLSSVSRQFPYFSQLLPEFMDGLPEGTDGQRARLDLLTHPDANDDQRSELLDYLLASGLRLDVEVTHFTKSPRPIYEHLKNNFTRDGQTGALKRLDAAYERQQLGEIAYLHRVITSRNASALDEILRQGIDPNALRVEGGDSALSLALAIRWHEGVRMLLRAGADPSLPTGGFESARAFAEAQNDDALVDVFEAGLYPGSVDTICGPVPLAVHALGRKLFDAVGRGDSNCAAVLLDAGAKPTWEDFRGWTAVHEASYQGDMKLLRLLLENGGDARATSRWGLTPMDWVGHKIMAAYFRELRLNVNGKEPDLLEEHYRQAEKSINGVMQLLLAAGASPNTGNKHDGTLLMAAIANDDLDRIRLLDHYGASWHTGSERKKPVDILGPGNSIETYRYILTESHLPRRDASGRISGDAAYTVIRRLIRKILRRDDVMQLGMLFNELPLEPELRRLSAFSLLRHLVPETAAPSRGYMPAGPTGAEALATMERTLASPERMLAFGMTMEALRDAQRRSIGRSRTLIAAVGANNLSSAKLLLENGLVDPDHQDECRNHAVDIADARGFQEMSALLRQYGASGTGNYRECET